VTFTFIGIGCLNIAISGSSEEIMGDIREHLDRPEKSLAIRAISGTSPSVDDRLLGYRDLWLIGGGGKTTLMYKLAAAWAARGERVVCATTTKIWAPTPAQCTDVRVGTHGFVLRDLREQPAPVVTVGSRIESGKCHGFPADETLAFKAVTPRLIVEADGSAGRPVKAHAPHEPVVADGATCIIAVVGAWCVGAPLDAEHVHRPELFAALSGRALGAPVTAEDVARAILAEAGWLRAVPSAAAFHVVITGPDRGIAPALAAHPRAKRLSGVYCTNR
jgi:probable selenium-dependent hydroxylase accessory protein YqeC